VSGRSLVQEQQFGAKTSGRPQASSVRSHIDRADSCSTRARAACCSGPCAAVPSASPRDGTQRRKGGVRAAVAEAGLDRLPNGVTRFPAMKNLAEFDFAVSPVNEGLVRAALCRRRAGFRRGCELHGELIGET